MAEIRVQQRHDTEANWNTENPVLAEGELGIVTNDPNKYKVGDGLTPWKNLPYRGFDGTVVHELGNSKTAVISQKGVTDAIDKIAHPLEITFTAASSVLEYTGQNVEVHLSWNVKRKGSTITPTSVVIKRGSSQIYSGATGSGQYTDNVSQLGTTSYTITVEADDMTETVSINVQQVLPMYFGFSTATEIGSLNITSLGKQTIKTSPTGMYILTNDMDGKYMWLCVPTTMTINRVTLNGFDVPMGAVSSGSTSLGSYKCYRSSNALVAQSYTIVIS